MEAAEYVTDAPVATSVYLATRLRKPLLIEGHAGVGKTEIAKVMARVLGTILIRLQCYEGLDAAATLYEWNYQKQILHIKLHESSGRSLTDEEREIFSEDFLLRRPLLQAISQPDQAPVLLIDEVDRGDEELEAFMLEIFSDWQVTIPEIGTIKASHPPYVVLTSNRTRELSDALRRRCLYLWIDYPDFDKEVRIVQLKVPALNESLAREVRRFMESLRRMRLAKVPGVAETLDWAQALAALHADHLHEAIVSETIGAVLKDADGIKRVRAEIARSRAGPLLATPRPEPQPPRRAGRAPGAGQEPGEGAPGAEPVGVPAASELEAIAARDFSTFSPDQLDEIYRLTLTIARRLARRISRRRRPSARRGRIDLRRTLRANLTRGELIDLRFRRRKRRSEEHTSELQSQSNLVCRLLLEKKKNTTTKIDEHIPPNND